MPSERKIFWLVRNPALLWIFQVLKTPLLIELINWQIEIVAMKIKLEDGGKMEKEKQRFFLSNICFYFS